MPKEQKACTPYLFQVCRQHFSEPVARVASELMFWSQCGQHKLRGRSGFFKEDAELVQTIGKDASSIRRALSHICAKVGENRPDALFEIDHGPKPGQRSGRVRWLFRKPRGDEMIREAKFLAEAHAKKRQNARTDRSKTHRSVTPDSAYRSAQNERTLYSQKDSSESHAESLSSKQKQRETPDKLEEKRLSEEKEKRLSEEKELTRLVGLWDRACTEANNAALAWQPSDVRRWSQKLIELIQVLRLSDISDEDMLKRLRLMAGDLGRFSLVMGDRFTQYNSRGLMIESFARFGQKLWLAVEDALAEEERYRKQWDYLKSPKKNEDGGN